MATPRALASASLRNAVPSGPVIFAQRIGSEGDAPNFPGREVVAFSTTISRPMGMPLQVRMPPRLPIGSYARLVCAGVNVSKIALPRHFTDQCWPQDHSNVSFMIPISLAALQSGFHQ